MIIAARIVRLLAFAVWMGALVFFGAVVAPSAAHIFGLTGPFSDFISHTLLSAHAIGTWCGVAMLVALRLLGNRAYRMPVQAGLVLLMIVLTFASNKLIILPMEHDRQLAGGDIKILLQGSPLRDDFDARHAWSTRVESVIILAGLGLAVLIGTEAGLRERISTAPPRRVFDLSDEA
jgi:putative copper export protein